MNITKGDIRGSSRSQTGFDFRGDLLFVGVLGLHFQLLLTSLTNPVVFAVNEGVVMNPLAVVLRA